MLITADNDIFYDILLSNIHLNSINKSNILLKKYLLFTKESLLSSINRFELNDLFWKYLFLPDLSSRLLLWLIAKTEVINIVIYNILVFIIYLSCIYLPMIYIVVWRKAHLYRGDPIWSTYTKLYIILSAASSNFAYIFIGQGVI